MNIKITSDSTCDLSPQQIQDHQIEIFPMFVNKGGESFRDGVTITPAEIFAHVAAGGDLCTTSAISVGLYQERFTELAKEYDAVIHISLGSGFSVTHNNARLAAEELCRLGVKKVVITLGSDGAMLYEDGKAEIIPAHKVDA
ncbi:MAG: DegV family protein, partial [Oscillospiraceae bacterium]|nr:DegV family protein [Oscillospiraceae bacterium]